MKNENQQSAVGSTGKRFSAAWKRLRKPRESPATPTENVEVELPPWKAPPGVRVRALVKKVTCGTFPPIAEDEIPEG